MRIKVTVIKLAIRLVGVINIAMAKDSAILSTLSTPDPPPLSQEGRMTSDLPGKYLTARSYAGR